MLEARSSEASEEDYYKAIKIGYEKAQELIKLQRDLIGKCGKEKMTLEVKKIDDNLFSKVKELSLERMGEILKLSAKEQREEAIEILAKEVEAKLVLEGFLPVDIKVCLVEVEKQEVRRYILGSGKRVDGRTQKEIRPITSEVGILPRTHGSSLFTRGQTQSLSVTTLGTGDDEQLIEALEGESYKSFMLHYSFPPFSVGETKPMRGPGRREIGHGALAERSLKPVMPNKDAFPYTVRVVSEILESNGSSSMATVCAATLSLMDAGVPIKKPVAGIALGLVKEGDKYIILNDLNGLEDHFGDMDFKVAGTKDGITALQLDMKIGGAKVELFAEALAMAKESRLFILGKMQEALTVPRTELSSYAPRIVKIKINPEKIGEVIGPGGKTIKKIIAATGATIDIEDDGSVLIASNDSAAVKKAIAMVEGLTEEVKVGKIYSGTIKRLMNFGAFCEIIPGKEGLIHVSELANSFVKDVASVVKVGQEVKVKVIEIDELGRVNLSMKQAENEEEVSK
jgi:polyribonucleotide nucleotidyltransferase